VASKVFIGTAFKRIGRATFMRTFNPLRFLFDFTYDYFIGKDEKELKLNLETLQKFIRGMIDERK
jgi:hypothetical protein